MRPENLMGGVALKPVKTLYSCSTQPYICSFILVLAFPKYFHPGRFFVVVVVLDNITGSIFL